MAITGTSLLSGNSGFAAFSDTFVTASITPSANKLQLLFVSAAVGGGATPITSVTGNGLTWTYVNNIILTNVNTYLYRALGSSPSSGAVTMVWSSVQFESWWNIAEFDGIDTGGTNGSAAIVQSATTSQTGLTTGAAVTLGAFGSVNNATYGGILAGVSTMIVPGSGFSELDTNTIIGEAISETEFRSDNSTSVNWTWSASTGGVTAIGCEIKAAGGGGGSALKRNSSLSGLGASGPFFHDPLSARHRQPSTQEFIRRDRIFVPAHFKCSELLERTV